MNVKYVCQYLKCQNKKAFLVVYIGGENTLKSTLKSIYIFLIVHRQKQQQQ